MSIVRGIWNAGALSDADDTVLQTLPDTSGQGHHATQGVVGNRPSVKTSVLNGKRIVRFNGVGGHAADSLDSASFALTAPWFYTVIAAFKGPYTAGYRGLFGFVGGSVAFLYRNQDAGDGDSAPLTVAAGNSLTYPSHVIQDRFDVYTLAYDGARLYIRRNLIAVGSEARAGVTATGGISIHTDSDLVDFAEARAYDGGLEDMLAVETEMQAYWRIPIPIGAAASFNAGVSRGVLKGYDSTGHDAVIASRFQRNSGDNLRSAHDAFVELPIDLG